MKFRMLFLAVLIDFTNSKVCPIGEWSQQYNYDGEISTNGTDPKELKQKYWLNYEEKLLNFSLKRKYGVNTENCLPQERSKVLQKLFNVEPSKCVTLS